MAAEDMGKVSKRLRIAFAISSVIFLAVLAVSPVKDYLSEWRYYQKGYAALAEGRPDTKTLMADYHHGINQIWVPQMGVVDRCTTCHLGITQASLGDPSVPEPYRAHPLIPHHVEDWGCVVCHRGQGRATEVSEAHYTTLAWERPMLATSFIQASCGECHRESIPQTPKLNQGRELLVRFNCVGCHKLQDIQRPAMLGPDLTNIGTKVSREWLYKWLKEPRTITDSQGNVTVDGVENEDEPRMPKFQLTGQELDGLSAYLSTLTENPPEPYKMDPRAAAKWKNESDAVQHGELRFRQMFCSDCHSLAVVRAGTTQLIGGEVGPELSKVGSKVKPEWLTEWLHNPQAYLSKAEMPRYQMSDDDLYTVSQYITNKLTDPDLLKDVPKLGPPTDAEIQLGRRLFAEKGCSSCHVIKGVPAQKDFGPDLSNIGSKTVSELFFGNANIPHSLIGYIQAKISDPHSVNPGARMPQFHFTQENLDDITTALLGMNGGPNRPELADLKIPQKQPEFHPAGQFGKLYERYKCYVCHRFNGFGGTMAPDLSYEGSRADKKWMVDFLKNPGTLRPTLIVRMPQFNMSDADATTIANYLETALQSPDVDQSAIDEKQFTPQMANLGKQLYEVKYQCQSCHTIGSTGGYVGPALTNVGNWITPAWLESWLKNPQALDPAAIEPRREFTPQEIQALTAYLLTLKQSRTSGSPGGAR